MKNWADKIFGLVKKNTVVKKAKYGAKYKFMPRKSFMTLPFLEISLFVVLKSLATFVFKFCGRTLDKRGCVVLLYMIIH